MVYVGYSQPREGVIEICSKHVGSVASNNLYVKYNYNSECV